MKKLSSTLSNMVLSLGVITFVAGASLGTAYYVTKEPIAQMAHQTQVEAIKKVSPEFTNDPEADKWEYEQDGITYTVYPAYDADRLVGAAVESASMSGFSGEIKIMCGFDADGTVRNYDSVRKWLHGLEIRPVRVVLLVLIWKQTQCMLPKTQTKKAK